MFRWYETDRQVDGSVFQCCVKRRNVFLTIYIYIYIYIYILEQYHFLNNEQLNLTILLFVKSCLSLKRCLEKKVTREDTPVSCFNINS